MEKGELLEDTQPEANRGIRVMLAGSRIGQFIHRLNSGRYEKHVPAEIRELAEEAGFPKPNTFIPSAQSSYSEYDLDTVAGMEH